MSGAEEPISGAASTTAPGVVWAGWFRAYGVGVVDVPDDPAIQTEASDLSTEPAESDPEGRGGVVYLG